MYCSNCIGVCYNLCNAEVNEIPCLQCSECEFEGTGKALKEHQLMHILPDELKFSSEEDVRKWREERKR